LDFVPQKDMLEDYHILLRELQAYNERLLKVLRIVVVNKIDLEQKAPRDYKALMSKLEQMGEKVMAVSALEGNGINELGKLLVDTFSKNLA